MKETRLLPPTVFTFTFSLAALRCSSEHVKDLGFIRAAARECDSFFFFFPSPAGSVFGSSLGSVEDFFSFFLVFLYSSTNERGRGFGSRRGQGREKERRRRQNCTCIIHFLLLLLFFVFFFFLFKMNFVFKRSIYVGLFLHSLEVSVIRAFVYFLDYLSIIFFLFPVSFDRISNQTSLMFVKRS